MPKLLCISDDIRYKSGVSIQSNKLFQALRKNGWDVVQIGVSLVRGDEKPVMVDGVKVYPYIGESYGDPNITRAVVQTERPDVILMYNDPRFYMWLFQMDNELRPFMKFVYWFIWDNEPFPRYNLKWFECCDDIVACSKYTHELLNKGGVQNTLLPLSLSGKEFFRMTDKQRKAVRDDFLKRTNLSPETDFIIFVNNRNQERKRLPDTILAFKRFHLKHPNSVLVLHTSVIDPEGVDLQRFIRDVEPGAEPVVFMGGQIPHDKILTLYNIADVTVAIPYNEGFGLSVAESLLCEVPVVASSTGGITEQMKTVDGSRTFGVLIDETTRVFYGNVRDPYIYRDYVNIDDVVRGLETCYTHKDDPHWQELGAMGRAHILEHYNQETIGQQWVDHLNALVSKPIEYRRFIVQAV